MLTASLQTPTEFAFEMCFLPAYSACCRAGVHLHIFEAIAEHSGPITAKEIAVKIKSEQLLVVRLLRDITSLGLVAEVGPETYQAIPATHAMALPMVRAAHQHFWDQGSASLLQFPAYLTEKGARCPTDASNGMFQLAFPTDSPAFLYWQDQPAPRRALDNFNFLRTCVRGDEPAWVSWFPVHERILQGCRPDRVVFVDVGGGVGHDASAFRRRFEQDFPKNSRVVLEDLPTVLSDAEDFRTVGLDKVDYDFFTPQVIKGARVYYFAHILHDWSDEACATILRNQKSAMTPGYSKILLHDFILPEVACSRLQAGFDIHMIGMHAGMERTRAQWTKLFESEGYKITKFWTPPRRDMEGIVEAELMDE